jgi:TP901 family phage tail tape measure protein
MPADASILFDVVLADIRQEDIRRIQGQISRSFNQSINIETQAQGAENLNNNLNRINASAQETGKSVNQLNAIMDRYNQNMLKAEMASERATDKHRTLTSQISATNRAYGELNAYAARLRQNENQNQKEISETESQMRKLRLEIQRLQREQKELQQTAGLDPFGKHLGGIRTVVNPKTGEYLGLKESFTTLQGIGLRMQSLFAGQIGTLMMVGSAITVVRTGIRELVQTNVELENSQANLRTVMVSTYDDINKSMEMAGERARELSHVVPLAASKISESMYYLASGGLKDVEMLNQITGSLTLATGALVEHKLAAETVTTAYNVWSEEMLRGTEIADKFQITIARNQVTGEQLAESFKYMASTGKMVGYSLDEVLAIIGALGTLGIRGSMAGTSLNQALNQLAKKRGVLKNLGIEITDAEGRLKSFDEVIQEFHKHYGDVIDLAEQEELAKILNIRAARGIVPFIENVDVLRESLANMEDQLGAGTKAMLEQTYTLTSGWQLFKNVLAEIAYNIFPDIKDTLFRITDTFNKQFEEALKTPEGIGAFEKIIKEQLKGGEFEKYFEKNRQIEDHIKLIRQAGLETESLNEFTDKYYSKLLLIADKIFDIKSRIKPSKGALQQWLDISDFNARKQMMEDYARVLQDVREEMEKNLTLEMEMKKALEGWEPFKTKAPFAEPKITGFQELWESFEGYEKEVKIKGEFGAGLDEEKKALNKMILENEKARIDLQKKILENEIKSIATAEQSQIDSYNRILDVRLKQINFEKNEALRSIDEQINEMEEKLSEARKQIESQGLDISMAPEDSQFRNYEKQLEQLKIKRQNIEKDYNQEILTQRLDTEKKINDYHLNQQRNTLQVEQQLINSRYALQLAKIENNAQRELELKLKMYEELERAEIELANLSMDNLEQRLAIIKNKYEKMRLEARVSFEKTTIAEEPSFVGLWEKMFGKMTLGNFEKRRAEINEQIKQAQESMTGLSASAEYKLKLYGPDDQEYLKAKQQLDGFKKYIAELRSELESMETVATLPGFKFAELGFDDEQYAKAQQNLLEAQHRLDMLKLPETDYHKRLITQESYLKELYEIQKANIDQTVEDEQIKTEMIKALDKEFLANRLELYQQYNDQLNQSNRDYINAILSSGGTLSTENTQQKIIELMATKNALDVAMENFQGTPVYDEFILAIQKVNDELRTQIKLLGLIENGTIEATDKSFDWGKITSNLPHAYSLVSQSIKAMNSNLDETTAKMLDVGEGITNIIVGWGNPMMMAAGAFQVITTLLRKTDKDVKQISSSAYEVAQNAQTGVSANYGQAQNITVQMTNAIKMDFLIPDGLTPARQEQIANTLVDEIGDKLSARGFL